MRRVLAKFVPCVLTIDQQKYSLSVVGNPLQEAEMDQNFTEDISTGDETLVHGCDPETKHFFCSGNIQSLQHRRNSVSCVPVNVPLIFLLWKGLLFTVNTSPKAKQ
jgi:hypothetical protein